MKERRWAIIGLIICCVLLDIQQQIIKQLEARKMVIIHKVDSYDGSMVGKVTEKAIIKGHPTVTIGAYGKFLVTQEQYDSIEIGDDVPEYLKKRGS